MSAGVIGTLAATTLLMAIVLALRAPVRRLFGSAAAYALWLAPALRMMMPPIAMPTDAPDSMPTLGFVHEAATAAVPADLTWLFWIWAGGAAAFGAWQIVAYRRFLRRALVSATRVEASGIAVFMTPAVDGPAAVGLLTRRILLPGDFHDRFDRAERALALRHEHVHHARRDPWANAFALAMLSLHWFNPLAWIAHRAFREDQELACDAAVLAGAGFEDRHAYGRAMVKSAWGAASPMICPMTRTGNLKRRLTMVKMHRRSAWRTAAGAAAAAMLSIGGLTLTATGAAAADPVVEAERIVVKRVAGQDSAEAAIAEVTKSKCGTANPTVFKLSNGDGGAGPNGATRFIMCNKDGAPVGDRLAALLKARDRIAGSSDVDADARAKVLGALDSAIARMRSAN